MKKLFRISFIFVLFTGQIFGLYTLSVPSAHELAMGGIGIAMVNQGYNIKQNPACIVEARKIGIKGFYQNILGLEDYYNTSISIVNGTYRLFGKIPFGIIYQSEILKDVYKEEYISIGFAGKLSEYFSVGFNTNLYNVYPTGQQEVEDEILNKQYRSYGFDIGGLLRLNEKLYTGFVIQDLFGKIRDDKIDVKIGVGISYQFSDKFCLGTELKYIVNYNKRGNWVYNIGFDKKLDDTFNFRAGFYNGAPTLGGGIKVKGMTIDYAYAIIIESNHNLSFQVEF